MRNKVALLAIAVGPSLGSRSVLEAPAGTRPAPGAELRGESRPRAGRIPPVSPVWWEAGHAVVCDIAWREVGPAARDAVRALLAIDEDYAEFGPSCYWPDVIRDEPRYRDFVTAHYVNLPPDADGFDAARDCARTLCAVEAIELFAGRLRDPTLSDADRVVALKFLGHFVGDLHQPLHAGYLADRGGNDVAACVPGDDDTNLHAVWDGFIVNRRLAALGLGWKAYGERLQADIRPVERILWRTLDPRVWANESYALTEDEVYAEVDRGAAEAAGCFGDEFVLRHLETTERRLKQAGYRLAALLDDIF